MAQEAVVSLSLESKEPKSVRYHPANRASSLGDPRLASFRAKSGQKRKCTVTWYTIGSSYVQHRPPQAARGGYWFSRWWILYVRNQTIMQGVVCTTHGQYHTCGTQGTSGVHPRGHPGDISEDIRVHPRVSYMDMNLAASI